MASIHPIPLASARMQLSKDRAEATNSWKKEHTKAMPKK